jgi:hypothetical protein
VKVPDADHLSAAIIEGIAELNSVRGWPWQRLGHVVAEADEAGSVHWVDSWTGESAAPPEWWLERQLSSREE